MDVKSVSFQASLSGGVHYVLPHFQRQYTWEPRNWNDLLNDIQRIYVTYNDQKPPEHFMGSLVVITDGTVGVSIPVYKLVDGQQRLTTISLLLRALYELSGDEKLRGRILSYLVNEYEDGDARYKVLPTHKNADRQTFIDVIDGNVVEREADKTASMIVKAYRYLLLTLRRWIEKDKYDPEKFFRVIATSLQFVFIKVDGQDDRPYAIFESLNAKGKPLTQTDLVRNYIAMKLPGKQQERLFNQYWAKIDDLLSEDRKVARIGELTAFLRHYIAFRTGTVEREDMIYIRFRDRMEENFGTSQLFEQELHTLYQFAVWYERLLRPEHEDELKLSDGLKRLNILESTTAYPLLLAAYEAYESGKLSLAMFVKGVGILENYLVRRMLVGDSGYTNRMFPNIIKLINHANYPDSLGLILARRRSVPDTRLRLELPNRPVYDNTKQDRLRFIFEEVERYLWRGTDGRASLDGKATLEHILPQALSEEWKESLGVGYEETHKDYTDTLGNLTLVTQSLNSGKLSNYSFERKVEVFRHHALRLNSHYFSAFDGTWDSDAIRQRADALIDTILKVWPSLGDTENSDGDSYISPVSVKGKLAAGLTFLNEEYPLNSWKAILVKMCECAIQYGADFEEITQNTTYLRHEKIGYHSIELSNGYYLYSALRADDVLRVSRVIGDVLDIEEGRDWALHYNNAAKSS